MASWLRETVFFLFSHEIVFSFFFFFLSTENRFVAREISRVANIKRELILFVLRLSERQSTAIIQL